MKTNIQAMDFSLTEALEVFIKNHAEKSMRASADLIDHVSVRLKDLNGPKGGCDKECSVEVVIPNSPSVVVTKRSSDAYACIRKALGRAARVTLRKISRKRSTALSRNNKRTGSSLTQSGALAAPYIDNWIFEESEYEQFLSEEEAIR